jgi:flagellar basal-body rod protein FlgF
MLRGMYSAATGMITQYKKIDVLGNNISNVNTNGFKGDSVTLKSFSEEIASRMAGNVPVGSLSNGVTVGGVSTDYTQGSLEQTGKTTDLYISGDGFFSVEASPAGGGVKYTRDGNFSVDNGGYLELASGERLLGSNGAPIYVGGTDFAVTADGTVTSGATQLGKIQLYSSQNLNGIAKRTDGFFNITTPAQANGKLVQGSLEGSNVDAISEMTGMMQATRSFQSCQQAFQTNEDSLDRLISQVGSLKA